MRPLTFRAKTTLWNVAFSVLGVVIAGLGLGYGARASLLRTIDSELRNVAEDRAHRAPRPPGIHPPPLRDMRDDHGEMDGPPPPHPPPEIAAFAIKTLAFNDRGEPVGRERGASIDIDAVSQALAGKASIADRTDAEGNRNRVLTEPVRDGERVVGAIQVFRPTQDVAELQSLLERVLLLFIPIAVAGGALSGTLLTNLALKPLGVLAKTSQKISAENWSERLGVTGNDELAAFGKSYNDMLDRLQGAFEQERQFTADASHELRTPLARMILIADNAVQPDANQTAALQTLGGSAREMSNLVEQLLTLAKADAGKLELRIEKFDLRVVLADVADEFGSQIELDVPDHPMTEEGDALQIKRAVRNLVSNAVRHSPPGSFIELKGYLEGSELVVSVTDKGLGIAAEHLPHLGERFYRPDESRHRGDGGTGLGLAIVKAIAEAHHGSLSISSRQGEGTCALIRVRSRVTAPTHPR